MFRRAGHLVADVLQAIPANVGYNGFPKTVCTSVNHVICHGIPASKLLKKGDIVNVDVAVIKDGWFGDCSRMYFVGEPSPLAKHLVDTTYEAIAPAFLQSSQVPSWVISGTRFKRSRIASISAWCASIAATALGRFTTMSRKCCITVGEVKVWN